MRIDINGKMIDFNANLKNSGLVQIYGDEGRRIIIDSFLGYTRFSGVASFVGHDYRYYNKWMIKRVRNDTLFINNEKLIKFNSLTFFDLLSIAKNEFIVELLSKLDLSLNSKYETMSDGETVIFNFIIGLIGSKKCLILDNCLASLDQRRRKIFLDLISNINDILLIILSPIELDIKSAIKISVNNESIDIKQNSITPINIIKKKLSPNRTKIMIKSSIVHRLSLLTLGLISTFTAIIPFTTEYRNLKSINETNLIYKDDTVNTHPVCFGKDDNCHFKTFFYLFDKEINFKISNNRNTKLPIDIIDLFPNYDSKKVERAFKFFKDYFELDFNSIDYSHKYQYYISISKDDLILVQKKLTFNGLYLSSEINNALSDESFISVYDLPKEGIKDDKYALVLDRKVRNIAINNNSNNFFKVYGTIESSYSDDNYIYKAYVHEEALKEYGENNSNYVKTNYGYSMTIIHNMKNPLMYRKYLPELNESFNKFLILLFIPLIVTVSLGLISIIFFYRFEKIKITKNNINFLLVSSKRLALNSFIKYVIPNFITVTSIFVLFLLLMQNISYLAIPLGIIALLLFTIFNLISLLIKFKMNKSIK